LILIFGGLTGGLGQPLHQQLCARYADSQVVMALGRKHCDVELESSIERFFAAGFEFSGPLHIINATGVSVSAMIHKTEVGDIGRMIRVNLVSNILMLKHARELYKKHGGTFTMLGSYAAVDGPVGTAVYAASKAALSGLTRVASKEFAAFEARVNCLELGYFNYGMIEQVSLDQRQRLVDRMIPWKGFGTAAAVAEACRFLIECDYVTGATIKVNGGL
jgi:3-oxoacyl-[acyl-carrier protein] reductase